MKKREYERNLNQIVVNVRFVERSLPTYNNGVRCIEHITFQPARARKEWEGEREIGIILEKLCQRRDVQVPRRTSQIVQRSRIHT